MSRGPGRNHSPEFKAKVVLAAVKGEKPLAELAEQLNIHPNQITQWMGLLLERWDSVRRRQAGRTAGRREDAARQLKQHGIAISMDGKGCWRDNVFVYVVPVRYPCLS